MIVPIGFLGQPRLQCRQIIIRSKVNLFVKFARLYNIWPSRGGIKSLRFVSKRTAFFGNTRCLSNSVSWLPCIVASRTEVKHSFRLHESLNPGHKKIR